MAKLSEISNSRIATVGASRTNEIDLTISTANWTTTEARGSSYRDSNGNYRLKFNIRGQVSGAGSTTSFDLPITGVTFKSTTNFFQACAAMIIGTAPGYLASSQTAPGTSNVEIYYSAFTNPQIHVSGDVILDSKPSWFDDNLELESGLPVATDTLAGIATLPQEATASTAGLLPPPTLMSDELATALGYKSYSHGTTYNGGNAPTITYASGGGSLSSVEQCEIFPYQNQTGDWFVNFSIKVTFSTQTRTEADINIAGITFVGEQVISASHTSSATAVHGNCRTEASGTIRSRHASATTNVYSYSGTALLLSSKPTWAY